MRKLLIISTDKDKWHEEMYHQKCVCGHELYLHGFTLGKTYEETTELFVSQCTFCDYDKEKEEFLCETFTKA